MTKIVKLHYPIKNFQKPVRQVVAMGFFDGVHRGHQAVIQRAKTTANQLGVPLAVLTYDPHPVVVFKTLTEPLRYLTTLSQKAALLTELGVDTMYVMQFTSQLAQLSPQTFVDDVVMRLNPITVVAGFDHLYGGNPDISNMDRLSDYAQQRFDVVQVPEFTDSNQKIGSTMIRCALEQHDVDKANRQLGRIYTTTGLIVHGEARGRELGFPTINVKTPELEWLPGIGIYAVKVKILDTWYMGMASIGRNITFGDEHPITVEINILDFKQDIYGEEVVIAWHHYLRGEVKFIGIDGLIEQLKQDEIATRQYFKSTQQ
ncbi:riboflavin biosynthesis protein RibF [Leuconostoc carnosum]|uniref:Riboflavin biosynthesis protein n=1 Tax=Leuconostoc carnosum (strain JB16) TaxID=1229758 RepID=K0DC87_LEUCJ|nr:riboflavin biosynthesis protein RibF [Leuconostoc carnosum]AFT81556.1 riboflavin biosynthesis protein RibF [Leuconostoc carnosum JB16]KAA8330360.1 riboflavin biosynthesis protein RibF [Leuconostoc carnosum]KAA8370727.1 riboflavin biosynthesis protein RibF [Leuconostoc carnosum]KAA8382371.1 riboflavin biosynthesis protein RibF [Leuconostoc carnosum]